jgi:DNA-binding response OmpR family regulator
VTHPRVRHTYTDLIEAAWPEDIHREGVSTEALYQLVRGLRRQIESTPSQPRYIVNWRGRPEGGYQCFPEGRPR